MRPVDAVVRINKMIKANDKKRDRRKSKKISIETISKDLSTLNLNKYMIF